MTATQAPATLIDTVSIEHLEDQLRGELNTTHGLFFHTVRNRLELITAHTVQTRNDGVPFVGPGRPLTPQDEETLLALLHGHDRADAIQINPPDVLYRDRTLLVWWLPPVVRPMLLRSHRHGLKIIQTRWPNLVAAAKGRSLYLVSLQGEARPDSETPVCHAPLPNVYANTGVCTGSAKLPTGSRLEDKAGWELVVFESAFTHVNHSESLKPPAGRGKRKGKGASPDKADADFWMTREGEQAMFPDALLNPLGLTLAQWVGRLFKGVDQ